MRSGYARVSTMEQNLDLREDAQKAAGCEKIYTDKTGGAKAERPGLERALAEFVRDIIQERTLAGLAAARARGRKDGRPRQLDDKKKRHAALLHFCYAGVQSQDDVTI